MERKKHENVTPEGFITENHTTLKRVVGCSLSDYDRAMGFNCPLKNPESGIISCFGCAFAEIVEYDRSNHE